MRLNAKNPLGFRRRGRAWEALAGPPSHCRAVQAPSLRSHADPGRGINLFKPLRRHLRAFDRRESVRPISKARRLRDKASLFASETGQKPRSFPRISFHSWPLIGPFQRLMRDDDRKKSFLALLSQ